MLRTFATYPGSPQITVDALLKVPTLLARSLTSLTSKRFVADRIFAKGSPDQVAGGSMLYQRSEGIYPDRGGTSVLAEEVGARSEFPRVGWTEAVLTAVVHKYGLEVPIAFESIRRNQLDQVARAQRKLANAVTKFVDTQAMSLILSDAAVLTTTATAAWSNSVTTIDDDIATMRKGIQDQDEGYEMDTLVVNPAQELFLLTNTDLRAALPREGGGVGTPLTVGRAIPILGLDQILVTPQLSAGTVLGLNAGISGTIADEQPAAGEGYVTYDTNAGGGASGGGVVAAGPGINLQGRTLPGDADYPANFSPVYVKIYNQDAVDDKIVRAARFPGMAILEPKSIFKLTSA